jgi:hypothetical protein
VEGVAHRIHDGADLGRDALQRKDIAGRHRDELGERAVAVHPDDPGILADVTVAGAALQAVAAHDVSFRGHDLPHRQTHHAVSHRHDLSGEFVADHERGMDPPLRPRIPIGDVQIGAADARVADRDQPARSRDHFALWCGQAWRAHVVDGLH